MIPYLNKVVLLLALSLSACTEVAQNDNKGAVESEEAKTIAPIRQQNVAGHIRATAFSMEQAVLENGTLTLRQGEDFFADVEIDIVIFDDEDLAGRSFVVDPNDAYSNPHIRLSVKREGENLPDQTTLLNGYSMHLNFDQPQALGIPFAIRFESEAHNTLIEGTGVATSSNVRLKDNAVDVTLDSFDTLEYLARQFLTERYGNDVLGDRFGVSILSYGKEYPKSAFIGFEAAGESSTVSVYKVRLAKDEAGWKAVKELSQNQIAQAHPVLELKEGNVRTLEGRKVKLAMGRYLEQQLDQQGLMDRVRATNINCFVTKNVDKASCSIIYGLKTAEDTVCENKSFLLQKRDADWVVDKEILDTQKVDYSSGKLVERRPMSIGCA